MSQRRYFSPTQPQTLQAAVMLLYFSAGFLVLDLLIHTYPTTFLLFCLAEVGGKAAGAYGIANDRKWGYGLGIASAFLPFVARLVVVSDPFAGFGLLGLLFAVILIVVLLHPQSREYARIWFK